MGTPAFDIISLEVLEGSSVKFEGRRVANKRDICVGSCPILNARQNEESVLRHCWLTPKTPDATSLAYGRLS